MSSTIYHADSFDQVIRTYEPIIPIYMENGKLSPLQRWLKGTIDFDQIVIINDACHIDRMGSGGHFVSISIETIAQGNIYREWMLQSKIVQVTKEEYEKNPSYPFSKISNCFYKHEYAVQESLKKCQEVILDDLIKYWRIYKEGTFESISSAPCCRATRMLNKEHCTTWRCPICHTEV
jgi:hypothetical protein